jgi:hypothetical protein
MVDGIEKDKMAPTKKILCLHGFVQVRREGGEVYFFVDIN